MVSVLRLHDTVVYANPTDDSDRVRFQVVKIHDDESVDLAYGGERVRYCVPMGDLRLWDDTETFEWKVCADLVRGDCITDEEGCWQMVLERTTADDEPVHRFRVLTHWSDDYIERGWTQNQETTRWIGRDARVKVIDWGQFGVDPRPPLLTEGEHEYLAERLMDALQDSLDFFGKPFSEADFEAVYRVLCPTPDTAY